MIRDATFDDIPALVELGWRFYAGGDYWGPRRQIDPAVFARHLCGFVEAPNAGFFVAEKRGACVGGILLLLVPDPAFGGLTALKLYWAADPGSGRGSGLRLLRHAERWATAGGATRLYMGGMTERSTALLARVGYERTETHYQRTL